MKPIVFKATLATTGLALVSMSVFAHWPQNNAKAMSSTSKIVTAANAFLATLTEEQRKKEVYAFTDDHQRARWSNFPTGFVPRGGLNLREMTEAQRTAAMALVSEALSKKGYEKVQQIMQADEEFKVTAGARDKSMFGKDLYYISMLGTPSETSPWMLQFGGHHLAINMTISGSQGVITPTLTGAQPAEYSAGGKLVRPLGAESDKGLALLNSLDETQKKQAILTYRVPDLVLGPEKDGKTIVPEGLKGSAMTEHQKDLMLDVISEWAGIVNDSSAASRIAELKAGLNDTWFAWSGSTTAVTGHNITAYYRIQGPKLVIEYSPQGLGGDLTQHVHAMYRDPTNDYGRGPTAK